MQKGKSMMSNEHLSVESLYLYAGHVFVKRTDRIKYKNQIFH